MFLDWICFVCPLSLSCKRVIVLLDRRIMEKTAGGMYMAKCRGGEGD